MTISPDHDNANLAGSHPIPRMMSDTDVALIKSVATDHIGPGSLLEIGPWLGGVSVELASIARLHVIDRFIWTEENAARVPDVAAPGESFQAAFEQNLSGAPNRVTAHPGDYRDLEWNHEPLAMVLFDAPRNGRDLLRGLLSITSGVRPGTAILVKNALNPRYFDMAALIENLLSRKVLGVLELEQPKWCNIAFLVAGPKFETLQTLDSDELLSEQARPDPSVRDPWGGSFYATARLAQPAERLNWDHCFQLLDGMPKQIAMLYDWDAQEAHLEIPDEEATGLYRLREAIGFHANPVPTDRVAIDYQKSAALSVRAYWSHNLSKPWAVRSEMVDSIAAAFDEGCMVWPPRVGRPLRDRSVLEIGAGLGSSAYAYLAAGAHSYFGVDTSGIDPDHTTVPHISPSDALPEWLAKVIAGFDTVLRVSLAGDEIKIVPDFCIIRGDDPATMALSKKLEAAFRKQKQQTELVRIQQLTEPPDAGVGSGPA